MANKAKMNETIIVFSKVRKRIVKTDKGNKNTSERTVKWRFWEVTILFDSEMTLQISILEFWRLAAMEMFVRFGRNDFARANGTQIKS